MPVSRDQARAARHKRCCARVAPVRSHVSNNYTVRFSFMVDYAKQRVTMVDTQVRPSDVTKFPIIDAMLDVPREEFVPRDQVEAAYVSENIRIAPHRVVLEPRTLGKLLDAINVKSSDLVLDIGIGYGYSSAVIASMAEAVIAVEEDASLATEAQTLLSEHGADNVLVHTGPLTDG